MSRPDGVDLGPRAKPLLRLLTVLKGPIRVQLSLDRPLPVNATVSGIDAPIRTQPIQYERIRIGL